MPYIYNFFENSEKIYITNNQYFLERGRQADVTLPDTINAATILNASSESYAEEMTKPILSDDNLESQCLFTNKWIIVRYNHYD